MEIGFAVFCAFLVIVGYLVPSRFLRKTERILSVLSALGLLFIGVAFRYYDIVLFDFANSELFWSNVVLFSAFGVAGLMILKGGHLARSAVVIFLVVIIVPFSVIDLMMVDDTEAPDYEGAFALGEDDQGTPVYADIGVSGVNGGSCSLIVPVLTGWDNVYLVVMLHPEQISGLDLTLERSGATDEPYRISLFDYGADDPFNRTSPMHRTRTIITGFSDYSVNVDKVDAYRENGIRAVRIAGFPSVSDNSVYNLTITLRTSNIVQVRIVVFCVGAVALIAEAAVIRQDFSKKTTRRFDK